MKMRKIIYLIVFILILYFLGIILSDTKANNGYLKNGLTKNYLEKVWASENNNEKIFFICNYYKNLESKYSSISYSTLMSINPDKFDIFNFQKIINNKSEIRCYSIGNSKIVIDDYGEGLLVIDLLNNSSYRIVTEDPYSGFPAISPNEKQVAFTGLSSDFIAGRLDSDNLDLYIVNIDGSNLKLLAQTKNENGIKGDEIYPKWSHDGLKLAFISYFEDYTKPRTERLKNYYFALYLVNPLTNELKEIYKAKLIFAPIEWSYDSNKIAISAKDNEQDDYEIYVIDIAKNNVTKLTDNNVDDFVWDWGSNDKLIFTSKDDLWVMDSNGDNKKQITKSNGNIEYRNAKWSPDFSKIVAQGYYKQQRKSEIFLIDLTNQNKISKLIGSDNPFISYSHPTWIRFNK